MITSRDNETLKLVRKLLAARSTATRRGSSPSRARISSRRRRPPAIEPVHLLVDGETVDEGLLARVSTLPHPARAIGVYRACRPADAVPATGCLALWRLADPGNVGTLLRTADAFGASVALSDGCADPLSPKALRASVGAIFRVPLVGWDEVPGRASRSSPTAATPLAEVARRSATASPSCSAPSARGCRTSS